MSRLKNLWSVMALAMLFCRCTLAQEIPLKQPGPLGPGDHACTLMTGEQKRIYIVHIPKAYDSKKPTPVILALHGAAMDGSMMV